MAYVKLMTNIPLTGRLSAAYFNPAKPNPRNPTQMFSEQISLKGTWDGQGEAYLSLNIALENDLRKLGVIDAPAGQTDKDGNQKYVVLYGGPVTFLKKEAGTKKWTEVSRADGSVAVPPVAPSASRSPSQSVQPAATLPGTDRGFWLALRETYRSCRKIALDELPRDTDPAVIQAATATLMIHADKHGQMVYPKAVVDEDDDPPF